MAGKINNQIENPDPLKTLNSLFLFNFIYVFIEPSKKTVGKIIGNRDGIRTYGSRSNLKICPYCRTIISDEHTKNRFRTYFEHIEHNQNIINFKKKSNLRKMIMITLSIKTVRDDKLFYLGGI